MKGHVRGWRRGRIWKGGARRHTRTGELRWRRESLGDVEGPLRRSCPPGVPLGGLSLPGIYNKKIFALALMLVDEYFVHAYLDGMAEYVLVNGLFTAFSPSSIPRTASDKLRSVRWSSVGNHSVHSFILPPIYPSTLTCIHTCSLPLCTSTTPITTIGVIGYFYNYPSPAATSFFVTVFLFLPSDPVS